MQITLGCAVLNAWRRRIEATTPLAVALLLILTTAPAQNPLSGTLTMGFGDVATLKRKAGAGDASAQVALGEALASNFHASEALDWYRKAAIQGNVAGEYHAGDMLLFGAAGIPQTSAVRPNHAEGIRWTFQAATNFHPQACWNMSRALLEGLGTSPNVVEAYAWLKLYAGTPSGSTVGRVHMNQLALKMNTEALGRAERLANEFKSGKWRAPVARALPEGDPRLKLSGIIFNGKNSLAVINGKTLSEGETVVLPTKPGTLPVKCLKIEKNSVLISVEGEDTPRLLHLR
jgi:hypothetical protein